MTQRIFTDVFIRALKPATKRRKGTLGDLSAAWKIMRKRGWSSEDMLARVKKELLEAGLIAETRKGGLQNRTTLYGLTWFQLDYCGGKLDMGRDGFPYGGFRRMDVVGVAAAVAPLHGERSA